MFMIYYQSIYYIYIFLYTTSFVNFVSIQIQPAPVQGFPSEWDGMGCLKRRPLKSSAKEIVFPSIFPSKLLFKGISGPFSGRLQTRFVGLFIPRPKSGVDTALGPLGVQRLWLMTDGARQPVPKSCQRQQRKRQLVGAFHEMMITIITMITAYRAHYKCFGGLKLKHQPKFPKKTSCSHIAKTMCRPRHWFSAVFDQRLRPW